MMSGGIFMDPGKCLLCGSIYARMNDDGVLGEGVLHGTPIEFVSGFFAYSQCATCQMDDVVDAWVEANEDRHG